MIVISSYSKKLEIMAVLLFTFYLNMFSRSDTLIGIYNFVDVSFSGSMIFLFKWERNFCNVIVLVWKKKMKKMESKDGLSFISRRRINKSGTVIMFYSDVSYHPS